MNDGFLNVGSVKLATTDGNDLGKADEKMHLAQIMWRAMAALLDIW